MNLVRCLPVFCFEFLRCWSLYWPPVIGVFDSGVGGLSVLQEIRKLLPEQDLVYVGDSAYCPYGSKSPEVLRERVAAIVRYLLQRGADVIVLACNSATIQAIGWCRERWPEVAFVGMEPGVKPAVEMTRSGVIGVFATEASLTGAMFSRLVARYGSDCEVLTCACPQFVEFVEKGVLSGPEVEAVTLTYGNELIAAGADSLVLGCTHYHFLEPTIQKVFPNVRLINTARAVARRVVEVAEESGSLRSGRNFFLTSGEPSDMARLRELLVPDLEGDVTVWADGDEGKPW